MPSQHRSNDESPPLVSQHGEGASSLSQRKPRGMSSLHGPKSGGAVAPKQKGDAAKVRGLVLSMRVHMRAFVCVLYCVSVSMYARACVWACTHVQCAWECMSPSLSPSASLSSSCCRVLLPAPLLRGACMRVATLHSLPASPPRCVPFPLSLCAPALPYTAEFLMPRFPCCSTHMQPIPKTSPTPANTPPTHSHMRACRYAGCGRSWRTPPWGGRWRKLPGLSQRRAGTCVSSSSPRAGLARWPACPSAPLPGRC